MIGEENKLQQLKPIGNKLFVRREESDTETSGGIIIPITGEEKKQFGTVVAVSPHVDVVKVGDVVLFGKYDGFEIEFNGETLVSLEAVDLIAVQE